MITSFKLVEYAGSEEKDFDYGKEHVVGVRVAEGLQLVLGGEHDAEDNAADDLPSIYVERQNDNWTVVISQDAGDATLQLKIPLDPDKPILAEANMGNDSMEFKR
jgi:hypothetical protein